MQSTFNAFMSKIIDYAGLFPPAQLAMDEAIRNYLRYKNDADEWMLSRFICPARRLGELKKYRDDFRTSGKPVQISFLGSGADDIEGFFSNLEEDFRLVNEFVEYHGGSASVDAYEVRLPQKLIEESNPIRISEFMNRVAVAVEDRCPNKLTPFYEGAFWGEWDKTIGALIEGISYHNILVQDKGSGKYQSAGFKLRCGGGESSMYPSPEQVAHVILTCKHHDVAMKATAGLHHPIRHFNEPEQVRMHGFLNVFGAGIISQYYDLSARQITSIIEDESRQDFAFSDSTFRWKELSVEVDQIREARSRRMLAFGTCSFDEPREDLGNLGFLE